MLKNNARRYLARRVGEVHIRGDLQGRHRRPEEEGRLRHAHVGRKAMLGRRAQNGGRREEAVLAEGVGVFLERRRRPVIERVVTAIGLLLRN